MPAVEKSGFCNEVAERYHFASRRKASLAKCPIFLNIPQAKAWGLGGKIDKEALFIEKVMLKHFQTDNAFRDMFYFSADMLDYSLKNTKVMLKHFQTDNAFRDMFYFSADMLDYSLKNTKESNE